MLPMNSARERVMASEFVDERSGEESQGYWELRNDDFNPAGFAFHSQLLCTFSLFTV